MPPKGAINIDQPRNNNINFIRGQQMKDNDEQIGEGLNQIVGKNEY